MKKRVIFTMLSVMMVLSMFSNITYAVSREKLGRETTSKKTEYVVKGTEYMVSDDVTFNDAVTNIIANSDVNAVIVFTKANIDVKGFSGVVGKHVTLKSTDENKFVVNNMGTNIIGDITFDNISCYNTYSVVFANGHSIITTERYKDIVGNLYGGGSKGSNVSHDTNIVLQGGNFTNLYGGGLDSNVGGSTNITIDGSKINVGNMFGGGCAKETNTGKVNGNVNINFKQGTNGNLFGGGQNIYSKDNRDAAKVAGTVTVKLGYEGAPAGSVKTGMAMYTYGGSWNSTVGNVVLKLLEGSTNKSSSGDRNYFGCGYRDTVLGTVKILVDGSDLNNSGYIYGGGGKGINMDDTYGPVKILNKENENHALLIQYSSPSDNTYGGLNAGSGESILTEIDGDVLMEIREGNLAFCILDNGNRGNCKINGSSEILIKGGRIAQIEGNITNPEKSSAIYSGCGVATKPQQSGYLYRFNKVLLKENAQVEINSFNFPRFESPQKPFYIIKGLEVQTGSKLITVANQSKILGNVVLGGTWEQRYVGTGENYSDYDLVAKGQFTSNGGTLISHGTTNIEGNATAK
ncbi:MAG: hypothetical protein RR630_10410, partial [Coprobacillus sp.]